MTIKSYNDASRVQPDVNGAVLALRKGAYEKCYLLPSTSSAEGFEVQQPPTNLLANLEHKQPLSIIIRDQINYLGSQVLYPQDQSAVASGIAQGAFRLLGSSWLDFLECTNVRWRRTQDNQWISMLTAHAGRAGTTNRILKQFHETNLRSGRESHNLTKHVHIFRIGLVLAELALKQPISDIVIDSSTNKVKLYMNGEQVDAIHIASRVDLKTNMFLGNMVLFCLSALQDRETMADKNIESVYFSRVVKQADQLERLLQRARKPESPLGNGMGIV